MLACGLLGGHTRTRSRLETGAVAVEFALVLPLLVILLLGITTSGLSYTHAIGGSIAAAEFMNEPTLPAMGGAPGGYDAASYGRDIALFPAKRQGRGAFGPEFLTGHHQSVKG